MEQQNKITLKWFHVKYYIQVQTLKHYSDKDYRKLNIKPQNTQEFFIYYNSHQLHI